MSNLATMIMLASKLHVNQTDKGGKPYILHSLTVRNYVSKYNDEELECIAVGHDIIEDCFTDENNMDHDMGYDFLKLLGFSDRVIAGIKALTKVKGQSYEAYKEAVKANRDAVIVKMADLRHNSDITRLKGISDKDHERIKRYHIFYKELEDVLNGLTN